MRDLCQKNLQILNIQADKILSMLSQRLNSTGIVLIESELYLLAKELDSLNENKSQDCVTLLKETLNSNIRHRNCLEKGFKVLKTQINIVENAYYYQADTSDLKILSSEYNKRGYRNSCIEVLEGRKLQLNLVEQKGYYLLQTCKEKIKIQEEILVIAAQLIQDLTYHSNLTQRVIHELEGLEPYRINPEVTEQEETIISSVYLLLFDVLLEINYNLTV